MTSFNTDFNSQNSSENEFEIMLDSFEGPLSLLLNLAQEHRIDLNILSLKLLAEQYISFIASTPALEKRADYLRMASHLTWLKSKRLLPQEEDEEEENLITEQILLSRLKHLKAIRIAAERINSLPQIGVDCWNYQGNDNDTNTKEEKKKQWPDMTFLLKSYGNMLSRNVKMPLKIISTKILDSRELLPSIKKKLFIQKRKWLPLFSLMPKIQQEKHDIYIRSRFSATFLVALILSHQGQADIKQSSTFSPLYIAAKDNNNE